MEQELLVFSAVTGGVFGLLVGIVPAVVGGLKERAGLGIAGFFCCGLMGCVLGLVGAVPVCVLFLVAICSKGGGAK